MSRRRSINKSINQFGKQTLKPKIFNINGYQVMHIKSNTDVTRVQSIIKSGSFAENIKNSGISHLLEHLLLEAWTKCKGDCIKYWSDKGITFNAFTGGTLVSYFITGISKHNVDMINFISNITANAKFNNKMIKKSKDAVKQELLNYSNNPSWIYENVFYQRAYPNTKNGLFYIGDWSLKLKVLDSITKRDLENFYKKWYTPENMCFVIVSKMSEKSVKEMFTKYLPKSLISSDSKESRPRQKKILNFPKCKEPHPSITYVKWTDAKKTNFKVGFVSNVEPSDNEILYLDFIKDILVGDLSSYLYKILRDEMGLIYDISLSFDINYCTLLSEFNFSTNDSQSKLLLETFLTLMKDFTEGKFKDYQMNRVRDRLKMQDMETSKNTGYLAKLYGYQLIFDENFENEPKRLLGPSDIMKKIKNVSKRDIVKISKKIFNPKAIVIVYQSKKENKIIK
jgi:predicted Zn-dependent peptidase